MRFTFLGLWLVGLVCFISLITSLGQDFRTTNRLNEEDISLVNPGINKLEITSSSPDKKYYRNRWFKMEPFEGLEDDTAYVKNIKVNIIKSPTDSFRVTMLRIASGPNKVSANRLANLIEFNAVQQDSLLIIDKGIAINRVDKFRNQRIVITVYVPVGKQIKIGRSVGWGHDIHFNGPWSNDPDIEFEDLEEGWDHDVDYVMKSDGLYTMNGKQVKGNPGDGTLRIGEDGINIQGGGSGIVIDSNGVNITNENRDNYRYDNNNAPLLIDTINRARPGIQLNTKDSLERLKKKIEQQLEKIDDKAVPNVSISYSLPAYNPMLILN
ncbi:MAG: hypothetical protein WKI04_12035 [Ferruginibacter sp.]